MSCKDFEYRVYSNHEYNDTDIQIIIYITPVIWHDDFISPWRVSIASYDDFSFQVI